MNESSSAVVWCETCSGKIEDATIGASGHCERMELNEVARSVRSFMKCESLKSNMKEQVF